MTPSKPAKKAVTSVRKRKVTKTQRRTPLESATPCVVAIGASAGGFDALHHFLQVMPSDSGLAFVVIPHLDPTRKSMASEVIGKWTSMPVSEARQNERVVANHVYTIPPNKYLAIKNGNLRLSVPKQRRGLRLPIDYFFDALGNDQKERAVGIILSGTGSDGSLGVKSIEINGGIVLVQDPDSAAFNGMPLSALATGAVKSVLPVEKMPELLMQYARHSYVGGLAQKLENEAVRTPALGTILDLMRAHFRFSFGGYKHDTLLRRIHRRMSLHQVITLAEYASLLKQQPQELDALFKDMFINVTDFFRDPAAWKLLASEVIAPMVRTKKSGDPIRVWVPACSTGEEAYSVAMLVLAELKAQTKHCPVMVFATDINEEALRIARIGTFPAGIAAHIPKEHLEQFFTADDHQYHVNQDLRGALVFGRHNLIADPPFSQLDLITCRNVLIYLEPGVQQKVLQLFDFALSAKGHLFLGTAESLGDLSPRFRELSKKWRIFQHAGMAPVKALDLPINSPSLMTTRVPSGPLKTGNLVRSHVAEITQRRLLAQFSPAAVLINGKHETIYFNGPTERYLQQPRGTPTQDVLALVREGLRTHLRGALREAEIKNQNIVVEDARVKQGTGYQPVKLSVIPMLDEDVLGQTYLIVFEETAQAGIKLDSGDVQYQLVHQLEDELRATREDLYRAIESKDASTEELKISNEEIISVNEELRSINEELESSKEELQSLNEELSTVNQQLQSKVFELENANNDLKNLLSSSDIATLCLDRKLRIKWFTPGIQPLFNLLPGDVGRPIGDFSEAWCGDGLASDAKVVLQKQHAVTKEVTLPNRHWYLRRLLPYRDELNAVSGITATFTDITESKQQAEDMLASQKTTAESLEHRVAERTQQLRELSMQLTLAEERERRALAQDLHDDLGQLLAVAKIKVTALEKIEKVTELKQRIHEINAILEQAHASVHSLTFQLSPPILEELGLIPALEWLGEEMLHHYGLQVKTMDDGKPKFLDTSVRTILFRAVRELLINVAKHADVARAIVATSRVDNKIMIEVEDEGIGFEHQSHQPHKKPANVGSGGFGLFSVRERLIYIGGEMRVESIPGDGTRVTLLAPLSKKTRSKEPA